MVTSFATWDEIADEVRRHASGGVPWGESEYSREKTLNPLGRNLSVGDEPIIYCMESGLTEGSACG